VADSALPQGTSVSVRAMDGGWRVRFDIGETLIGVAIGYGSWLESSPLGRRVVA